MSIIDCQTLAQWQDQGKAFTLIDVLPKEYFVQSHLPGAVNACVYEVDFAQQIAKLVTDKEATIVVYGPSEASLASMTAAEKLIELGYQSVFDFRQGLAGCTELGRPVERTGVAHEVISRASQQLCLDTERSRIQWVGRNLGNCHEGSLRCKSGTVSIQAGQLASATVVIDMTSIVCGDLQDPKFNRILIDHLNSDDFFDVVRFPEAMIELTAAMPIADAPAGMPSHRLDGMLTLKNKTHPVQVEAVIGETAPGSWAAQGDLSFDRTQWGVNYGSGKLYLKLGKHLVNDLILLQFAIYADD